MIESVDGEVFVGRFVWSKSTITRINGTISRQGKIEFRFTGDIVGQAKVVGDAKCIGTITPKVLSCEYYRSSLKRWGRIEAKAGD